MTGGFFEKIFDFDGDGKLNPMERAMDFMAFNEMTKEEDETYEEVDDELELAGLDYDELSYMDDDERREALEDAGLGPDDDDF